MQKNEKDIESEKQFYEKFSKPFFLTKMIFKHPCYVILTGVALTILCTIIIMATNAVKMDDIKSSDLLVSSDYRVERQDSVDVAEEKIDEMRTQELIKSSTNGKGMPLRTQSVNDHTTIIMYENSAGNVFTQANLKKMIEIENNLITRDNEKIKYFCKAQSDNDDSCSSSSRVRVTALFNENMSQSEIDAKLQEIVNDDDLFSRYKILFGEDFTKENPKSKLARSIFSFAMPLEIDGHRYQDIYDNFDEQDEKFCEFMYDFYKFAEDQQSNDMSTYVYASSLELYVVMQIALKDGQIIFMIFLINIVNWIFASFAFILIYIIIHTQSFVFPTVFTFFFINLYQIGMLQIIMSLPIAFFLNRYIFCVTYFSMMNLIVLFLILGISAEKRFNFTYKKAIRQISTTTSTTVFNFIMTAVTPLLPIGSFGFFAVSLVFCNYLLVLSFYPSMFIFYAQVMEKRKRNKQSHVEQPKDENNENQSQSPQKTEKQAITTNGVNENNVLSKEECIQLQISPKKAEDNKIQIDEQQSEQLEVKDNDKIPNQNQQVKPNIIEIFFDKYYSPYLYKARIIVLLIFLIWFGISIYFTSQLKAPKEATQAAPDNSLVKKAKDRILDFNSGQSDNVIKIYLVWGISGIDRDTISDRWNSNDKGNVIWDNTFDITSMETQQRIYDICQDLKKNYIGTDLIQDNGVNCFLEDFKTFVENKGYSFPVQQSAFMELFNLFIETDNGKELMNSHHFGIIENSIKYVKIICYGTTLLIQQKTQQKPLMDRWENIMNNYNKDSPETCNKGLQTAGFGWVWMVTEDKLISNTIVSLIATGAFAFFVLSCSTLNLIAALYSTLSIIGIVICILGLIKMFGWYLGLIETIAASIVVGFSVEYIVFLCIYYLILNFDTRYQKVRQSLTSMGISILGGAITTLGAGIFLVMGEMDFFSKMGKLLIFTIIFSLLWSLGFFSSLLMVCGPMGNTGSIISIIQKIKQKCVKSQ